MNDFIYVLVNVIWNGRVVPINKNWVEVGYFRSSYFPKIVLWNNECTNNMGA